jgi:hypothetical protein
MNEELEAESYGGMRIEIEVKCGRISEVAVRTMVELPDRELLPVNASKIRDTILFLRSTIPITEIRAEDAVYEKPIKDPVFGKDGKVTMVDPEISAAVAGQMVLRKALKP